MVFQLTVILLLTVFFLFQTNESNLSATFSLDKWPRSCCQFVVQVNIFLLCHI